MTDEQDVVEGQDLIDELCWRFGTNSNNSTDTPTDPFASARDDDSGTAERPSHDEIGEAMREAIEYDGDDPRDWDIPDDEPIEYHAALRARERSDELSNTSNWELIGYAAALAFKHDISKDQLLADLEAHPTPQYGYDESRARKEIRGVWRKAENGNYRPPSTRKLARRGILPDDWANGPPSPQGLVYRDDGYYKLFVDDETGEVTGEKQVTNFHAETISRLEHDNGDREFHIRIRPFDGDPYVVTVEPTDLIDARKFRDKVLVGWSTTFDGGQQNLNAIKEFLASQDAPVRRGTGHIGLHDDEWVLPDGSLTADGWSDEPDNVFVAANTPVASKCALSPSKGDEYDVEAVRRILRLLPQTRLTERWLPALGWFYAATTRPYIQQWEGEFNILGVTGDSGAGKTAALEMLWECFGVDGDLLRADGTTFPKMRALATSNALPIIFDEYKPSDMSNYVVDDLHSLLRTSTRGGIEEKGRPDGSVVGHELLAPAVISGEQALRGTAEERRTLQTNFSRRASVGGTDESRAFTKLTGGELDGEFIDGVELTNHAIAYYQWLLQQSEADLKVHWRAARDKVATAIEQQGIGDLDDMRLQAVQTFIYGCRIYRDFTGSMGVDGVFITEIDVEDAVHYILGERTSTQHVSNLDRLLEVAARASAAGYLHDGEHYKVIHEGEPDEELRIKLSLLYDQLRRYARDHDIQDADLLDSGSDYRSRIKEAAEEDDGYIISPSKQTAGLNRCVAINTHRAETDIEGFEPAMWRETDDSDSDDGDGELTSNFTLSDLDPSRGQPVSFTATVASNLDPKPWLQAEGVFKGDAGVARFVARGSENVLGTAGEGDRVEVRDAMVTTNDDGSPVIELIDGLTNITSATSPDGQAGLNDVTATDGGSTSVNKRVDDYVHQLDAGADVTTAAVAGETGIDPETVRDRLESLASETSLIVNLGADGFERL